MSCISAPLNACPMEFTALYGIIRYALTRRRIEMKHSGILARAGRVSEIRNETGLFPVAVPNWVKSSTAANFSRS